MPFLVQYDADAVQELAALTSKEEKRALFNAVDKLRMLGPRLVPPHVKTLKGEAGIMELRPKQGRTHVRAFFRRTGNDYVVLSLCIKPDKADAEAAIAAAQERVSRYDA